MGIADTFENGLRTRQIVGALSIVQQRRVLLADQPGAGKTAQALFALEMAGMFARESATLVLCNTTGCQLTWAGELKHRLAGEHDVIVVDLTDTAGKKTMPSVAERNDALGRGIIEAADTGLPMIVLANFELVRWKMNQPAKMSNLFSIVFDAVVIDEGHLVLPTMVDADTKLTQFWFGLKRLQLAPDPILLDMTGTPDRGKLWNRYGHWKFLHPDAHRSFWGWARMNFVVTQGSWGGAEIGKLRNPLAWEAYDRQHMIRRTKAEMLEGLPPKQWAGDGGIDLPMTTSQAEAYEDYQGYLEQKEMALIADDKQGEAAALKLQFALRARQMATCTWAFTETQDAGGHTHSTGKPLVRGPEHSNKLAWLLDWLDARGFGDATVDSGKVVIVSYFAEVLHWLAAELKAEGYHDTAIIDGSSSSDSKIDTEARFQRGSLPIVLLSGYMGVSINLDAADDCIFMDAVHDPDRMEQVEDRIHRASRNHVCTYWRLASLDTADMVVLQTLDTRYAETRKSYEGARGVAFARRMLGTMEVVDA